MTMGQQQHRGRQAVLLHRRHDLSRLKAGVDHQAIAATFKPSHETVLIERPRNDCQNLRFRCIVHATSLAMTAAMATVVRPLALIGKDCDDAVAKSHSNRVGKRKHCRRYM